MAGDRELYWILRTGTRAVISWPWLSKFAYSSTYSRMMTYFSIFVVIFSLAGLRTYFDLFFNLYRGLFVDRLDLSFNLSFEIGICWGIYQKPQCDYVCPWRTRKMCDSFAVGGTTTGVPKPCIGASARGG
jgi:hypothetical protein